MNKQQSQLPLYEPVIRPGRLPKPNPRPPIQNPHPQIETVPDEDKPTGTSKRLKTTEKYNFFVQWRSDEQIDVDISLLLLKDRKLKNGSDLIYYNQTVYVDSHRVTRIVHEGDHRGLEHEQLDTERVFVDLNVDFDTIILVASIHSPNQFFSDIHKLSIVISQLNDNNVNFAKLNSKHPQFNEQEYIEKIKGKEIWYNEMSSVLKNLPPGVNLYSLAVIDNLHNGNWDFNLVLSPYKVTLESFVNRYI